MSDDQQKPAGRLAGFIDLHRVTLPLCGAIAIFGIAAPDQLTAAANAVTGTTFKALDWFFMTSVSGLLLLCLWLALGRYRGVRLGADGDRPEFSTFSWLAMLFAAGMGVGLLFWGVAEPMMHFTSPPLGEGRTAAAARQAMVITNFHWGLHAWAIYAMAALVLAYFGFRRGAPYLAGAPIRQAFNGRWVPALAHTADLVAVMAVVFGVSGSLSMGTLQIQTGLNVVLGVSRDSTWVTVGILVVLAACYMASASTGLDRGIKWLSNINMTVAILLMLFVLLVGPTGFLLRGVVTTLGDYLASLVGLSLRLYPYQDLGGWIQSWTLTYFIWWIAWAPFVGIFIARISRGRTIRQFIIGVVLAPTLFSILWFGVFGGTGFHEELHGAGGMARLVSENVTVALFSLLDRFPLSGLLSGTSILLMFVFLVTSVDSATFVLGMLTSHGTLVPTRSRKLSWGVALGLLSAAITFMGDINVVKAITISGAVPYSVILLVQLCGLLRVLARDQEASLVAGDREEAVDG